MKRQSEVKRLRGELAVTWRLIRECLDDHLKALYAGGISAIDQSAFWGIVSDAESFIDLIDYGKDVGAASNESINRRIEELEKL